MPKEKTLPPKLLETLKTIDMTQEQATFSTRKIFIKQGYVAAILPAQIACRHTMSRGCIDLDRGAR